MVSAIHHTLSLSFAQFAFHPVMELPNLKFEKTFECILEIAFY